MPSKVMEREIWRYRASVTVYGQTVQKMYPDESKKTYQRFLSGKKKKKN